MNMNEKGPLMNKPLMKPPMLMKQPPPMTMMMNPPPPQAPAPPPQVIGLVNKRIYQQNPHGYLNSGASQMMMNPQQQMMNRYGMWGHPPPLPPQPQHPMDLQLPYQNPMNPQGVGGGFGKPLPKHQLGPRNNWKGKKKVDKRNDLGRRMENPMPMGGWNRGGGSNVGAGVGGGFNPPSLNELQSQNRVKTKRYYQKNYYNNGNGNKTNNMGKFAPRNTTSFIMRAKKSGGITELVSPCPPTPAILPTPKFSPSREVLGDMAKEEWGVDGYGSMNGLIRLRSPFHDGGEEGDGSSGSDVEEHVEVERRLDHDLSRFEMIYPHYRTAGGEYNNNVLGNRVDDQDSHIAQLEDENLILKERLFLMEREMGDLRRRLQYLERTNDGDSANEEVVENVSENESENRSGPQSMEDNIEELGEENLVVNLGSESKKEDSSLVNNGNGFKVESGSSFNEEKHDEAKDSVVESDEPKGEVKINNVEIQVETAVGQGQGEEKDAVMVNDVEQKAQVNTDGNNTAEAPEDTIAGEDVSMKEVADNAGGVTEEN